MYGMYNQYNKNKKEGYSLGCDKKVTLLNHCNGVDVDDYNRIPEVALMEK
jgi:hypothetical protein